MKYDNEAQMVLNTITNALRFCGAQGEEKLKWWFCFGTLEEYIADLTFTLNYDIDIGVLYNKTDPQKIIDSIKSAGFYVKKMVVSDHTGNPLKIQFKINREWPDIDVYFWVEHKGILYHTYDEKREGKEKLSSYTFRGIKKEWISPHDELVEKIRRSGPEMDRILDKQAIWHYDIFGDHSGYEFQCPFAYGSCLDAWYPVWRFRKYYKGNSMSEWKFNVKSCKGLC